MNTGSSMLDPRVSQGLFMSVLPSVRYGRRGGILPVHTEVGDDPPSGVGAGGARAM